MSTFILRRIILAIPVLFGILLVTFALGRSIPGDPCKAMLGEKATEEVCVPLIQKLGLNEPIPTQFAIYLSNIAQGDLGNSFRFGRPVTDLLVERLPVTLELAVTALIFAIIAGIPLGIVSAYRYNSKLDVITMVGANIGVSMPVFWLGLMLAFIFSVILKDTPFVLPPSGRLTAGANFAPFYVSWGLAANEQSATGLMIFISRLNILNSVLTLNGQQFIDALRHLILPAMAVGTIPLSIIARMTRSSVLETLGQDYVRTARAKGLSEYRVVIRHAVSNALLPVVTIIGLNFGGLIAGAVLTETIFGFAGIGKTLFDGITARDYALVQGVTLVTAIAFVVINLLVDILYGYIDPRIRLS
ncbi:MAG: ABC transporter permease subunit [Anaerolineaceae bacterium]|nr:ABC transporter permease subunit [Anaerolineaceae bacterium]